MVLISRPEVKENVLEVKSTEKDTGKTGCNSYDTNELGEDVESFNCKMK